LFIACELLKEAEKLIEQKIHPQTIIDGWRNATAIAREALKNVATDNSTDEKAFHEDLLNIARTTLSSKILSQHKEHFSKLAVDAVLRLKGSGNLSAIQVIKKRGATLAQSFLDEGFLLDKKPGMHQPEKITNAKILIANTPMDTDKIKVGLIQSFFFIFFIHYIYTATITYSFEVCKVFLQLCFKILNNSIFQ
jgi:T-complex protein 1 subunit beta